MASSLRTCLCPRWDGWKNNRAVGGGGGALLQEVANCSLLPAHLALCRHLLEVRTRLKRTPLPPSGARAEGERCADEGNR